MKNLITLAIYVFIISTFALVGPLAMADVRSTVEEFSGTPEKLATLANNSQLPIVVQFGAEWCGFCKIEQKDIREALEPAYRGKIRFIHVDVDRNTAFIFPDGIPQTFAYAKVGKTVLNVGWSIGYSGMKSLDNVIESALRPSEKAAALAEQARRDLQRGNVAPAEKKQTPQEYEQCLKDYQKSRDNIWKSLTEARSTLARTDRRAKSVVAALEEQINKLRFELELTGDPVTDRSFREYFEPIWKKEGFIAPQSIYDYFIGYAGRSFSGSDCARTLVRARIWAAREEALLDPRLPAYEREAMLASKGAYDNNPYLSGLKFSPPLPPTLKEIGQLLR